MNPIYLDIHIHTSENPDRLVDNYDLEKLIEKINFTSKDSEYLISLTDHNTINKKAYLEAKDKVKNLLLGVELHVRNYIEAAPYHCHIYFDSEINEQIIDDINKILDSLYPKKVVRGEDNIPSLDEITKLFDSYEFLLLPHGGQSHSTFDKSIPKGVQFDNRIERGIYYNQFDGFTARSNSKLETTIDYFEKLGINEFVNLITCTDNYNPQNYPNAKDTKAEPFIPTWMLALPTFDGLRLSLSESSRLKYSNDKPTSWSEHITKVFLKNDLIDIDVDLTPGLNVIIGGSSSGKTLFVDSLYKKISGGFDKSDYLKYEVQEIKVVNPSNIEPHYLYQNYIIKVIDNKDSENKIDDINIIKNVFPGDQEIRVKIDRGLAKFKAELKTLIESIKILDSENENLKRIPLLSRLITNKDVRDNIISTFIPSSDAELKINYTEDEMGNDIEFLNGIEKFLNENPLIDHNTKLIPGIKLELQEAYKASDFELKIRKIIKTDKAELDSDLKSTSREQQTKKQDFDKLLLSIKSYSLALNTFYKTLKLIASTSLSCDSQVVESMGHKLYIENKFILNRDKFTEVVNKYLKPQNKINDFKSIQPEDLFESRFKKQMPVVRDYEDFVAKIYSDFESLNKKTYKIITKEGKNFENLSAGWKTSVILDIILGYEGDMAPLIIDQPEDNLATNYINTGLIEAIKNIKSKKQILLVSHNATIPMLGDAQNVVLCKNDGNIIKIRSSRLEGKIDDKSIVDHIAEITDGGKRSIKKRVKKYNLKNFRE